MNLIQVTREFADEEKCLDYLEQRRWPNGIRCPVCGSDKYSIITRKTQTKNKRDRFYACLEPTCKHRFSSTAGTLFHGSHIPLRTWFMAITIIMDAKKGMSARQLQQHLGIGSYRTAWFMVHRIRKAMEEHVFFSNGTIEMDETYVGGKTIRRGRSPRPKDTVMGIVQRGGKVKFKHIGRGV